MREETMGGCEKEKVRRRSWEGVWEGQAWHSKARQARCRTGGLRGGGGWQQKNAAGGKPGICALWTPPHPTQTSATAQPFALPPHPHTPIPAPPHPAPPIYRHRQPTCRSSGVQAKPHFSGKPGEERPPGKGSSNTTCTCTGRQEPERQAGVKRAGRLLAGGRGSRVCESRMREAGRQHMTGPQHGAAPSSKQQPAA